MDKHQYRFLVLNLADTEGSANAFATQAAGHLLPPGPTQEVTLLKISKSADNPFQSHMSVGRARNCDLVIRHRSVSKLHARFKIEQTALLLSDAGSQNGTFVNAKRLLPNEVVAVSAKDQLMFGSVAARTLEADAVYDLLRQGA